MVDVFVGLDEGLKLVSHIFNSAEYHHITNISAEAFKAFQDYSFAQFRSVGVVTEAAAKKVMSEVVDFGTWLKNTVSDPLNIKYVKRAVYATISDPVKLHNAPPETLGAMVLRTIMATVEQEDFDAIIKVLEAAKSDHELKWILRRLSNATAKDDENGVWLQEGIKTIVNFGIKLKGYTNYKMRIQGILNEKKIIIR